jgi:hypothetical protein
MTHVPHPRCDATRAHGTKGDTVSWWWWCVDRRCTHPHEIPRVEHAGYACVALGMSRRTNSARNVDADEILPVGPGEARPAFEPSPINVPDKLRVLDSGFTPGSSSSDFISIFICLFFPFCPYPFRRPRWHCSLYDYFCGSDESDYWDNNEAAVCTN